MDVAYPPESIEFSWILGDIFLRNLYVTYNYGNSSVEIAPTRNNVVADAPGLRQGTLPPGSGAGSEAWTAGAVAAAAALLAGGLF